MTREEQIETAAKLLADSYNPDRHWQGASGETVTGKQVARHLMAALALLERYGWDNGHRASEADDRDPLAELTETSSIRDMLRALITAVQGFCGGDGDESGSLTLALRHVGESEDGDPDTDSVASRCAELILTARTGASFVSLSSWERRLGRTFGEIRDLLATAAQFAREHGPQGGGR